jgi:hypothetical protein
MAALRLTMPPTATVYSETFRRAGMRERTGVDGLTAQRTFAVAFLESNATKISIGIIGTRNLGSI